MSGRAWVVAAVSLGLVVSTTVIGVIATARGSERMRPAPRGIADMQTPRQHGAPRFRGVHGRLRATFRRERPSRFDALIRELTEQFGPLDERPRPPLISPPTTLEGTLSLFSDGTGVIATEGVVSALTWQRVGDKRARVEAGGMHARGDRLTWANLELTMDDADDDGLFERARTLCTCTWTGVHGDIAGHADVDYDLAVEPVADGPVATLSPAGHWEQSAPLVPTEAVQVRLSAPLPALRALAALRVTADGRPHPGRVEAVASAHAHAAHFVFTPDVPLPFGATLGVTADGVADLAGHPMRMGTEPARVVDDPGTCTGNLGFETGMHGWTVRGDVRAAGPHEGVAPREGAAQAVVENGWLIGYIDVPATASRLSLSVTLLADASTPDKATGWVRVVAADERRTLDLHQARPGQPMTLDVDLVSHRGQRLFLEAEAYSASFVNGLPGATLLIDAIRVE